MSMHAPEHADSKVSFAYGDTTVLASWFSDTFTIIVKYTVKLFVDMT